MAEILAITGSISSIFDLIGKILGYANDVRCAHEESENLTRELERLRDVLDILKENMEQEVKSPTMTKNTMNLLSRSVAELERLLHRIGEIIGLDTAEITQSSSQSISKGKVRDTASTIARSVSWPVKKGEIASKLAAIERCKSNIHTALLCNCNLNISFSSPSGSVQRKGKQTYPPVTGSSNSNHTTNINVFNLTSPEGHKIWERKEMEDALHWLSPLEFYTKHADTIQRRTEDTGKWLLENPSFKEWVNGTSSHGTLLCTGLPGAGKSVLASIVIDYLRETLKDQYVVLYAYCNVKEKEQQTAVNLVSSLLRHLATDHQTDEILKSVMTFYHEFKAKGSRPSKMEYSKILCQILTTLGRSVFIVVDALDEYLADDRDDFLAELKKLPVRLFCTTRDIPEIISLFHGHAAQLNINNQVEEIKADIKIYLDSEMKKRAPLAALKENNPGLAAEIVQEIHENAGGMFLLARLHLESVASQISTPKEVFNALKSLPKDINETYDVAILRAQAQGEKRYQLAKQILTWITYARRPLTVRELQYAISRGTTIGGATAETVDESLPPQEVMISVCVGLVNFEEESKQLRLVHYTAQEYFLERPDVLSADANAELAISCINYLFISQSIPLNDKWDPDQTYPWGWEFPEETHPFLSYAAQYWYWHTRHGSTEELKTLVTRFLEDTSKIRLALSWASTLLPEDGNFRISKWQPEDFKPLLVAAACGLPTIVEAQLQAGVDVRVETSLGESALILAARFGHSDIARLLLKWTGYIERKSGGTNDLTRLKSRLFQLQHSRKFLSTIGWIISQYVVKRTRKRIRFINHIESSNGCCALYWATRYKHIEFARLLIDAGANVDRQIKTIRGAFGEAPLHAATWSGCTELAQILLDSGANYDIQDEHGATPLHIAVEYDRNEIAKLLLDKGASCDIRDDEGNTPLRKAWKRRHLKLNWGLIKLLLEKGATCGVSELVFEFRGVAPLHIAAQNGKLEIVRLLLERGANPNVRDCQNYTPLQRALELNDPDGTDIAKLLLQMEKGGNDSIRGPGFDGVTALHTAAKNGKLEIANLLLGEGVDCDLSDRHGATPLRRALECQSADGMEIAKLLLERGARYDPDNAPDGATFALLRAVACSKGNTNVALMQMLLEKEVNYTFQDRDRRTLLHFAAGAGSEGVVELLLEKDPEFNVDCRCHAGKTPLHEAAKNGEANIVQMLLTKRANPNIKDALGRTPLHASLMGYERIRTMSSFSPGQENVVPDNRHAAASLRYTRVVQLLVDNGTNPDLTDVRGESARSFISTKLGSPTSASAYREVVAVISQTSRLSP